MANAVLEVKNPYLAGVIEKTKAKNANEPEFIQAMEEVLSTIEPVVDKHKDEYEKSALL